MKAIDNLPDIAPPLPANVDAERSALAAALLDSDALKLIVERLRSEDFFLAQHRRIFAGIIRLRDAGVGVNLVTVVDDLERNGSLEAAGGAAYVSQLGDSRPVISHIQHYARIVKDKAVLRHLAVSASAIQEQALAGGDPAVILDRAHAILAAIPDVSVGDDLFDTWEEFQNAKPLRSLIENFFHADVCNVIGGLSGHGKTIIQLAETKALLTGKPLFGFFKVLEIVPRVIYLIPECARSPFFHRAKLFGLEKYIENGRLKVRTLTKGFRIPLNDPRLLTEVKGAGVFIDTAIRFLTGKENDAGDISNSLATDIYGLLAAGAEGVGIAHHSAKNFEKENRITLENVLRGSGDFGAFVGAGFGIRQIDEMQNVIHLEDIKPRDAEPFPPFQIVGRPWINQEGDFRMYRKPGDCNRLADYVDLPGKSKGGAPAKERENKASNLEHLRTWLKEDPTQTSTQLADRFKKIGVRLKPDTIRGYKSQLEKSAKEEVEE